MRLKPLFLLVAGLLCAANLRAQILWEISGNQLQASSYLFGTIHIGDQRVFEFPDSMLVYFDQCDAFAGELNMVGMNLMKSMEMISKLQMPGDTSLKDLLPPHQYDTVHRKLVEKMGFFAGSLERWYPFLLQTVVNLDPSEAPLANQMEKASANPPLDLYLSEKANRQGMEVIGLETVEEQVKAFNIIPLREQAKQLYESVLAPEVSYQGLEDLIQLYLTEDLDSMVYTTGSEMSEAMRIAFLDRRNHNMALRIHRHLETKRLFVGVGAAHLAGDQGVIALLRQYGYRLRPIGDWQERVRQRRQNQSPQTD